MINGITEEIQRLEYTAWQCRGSNPHNLDIPYMDEAARLLRAYRDLHVEFKPLPPFNRPLRLYDEGLAQSVTETGRRLIGDLEWLEDTDSIAKGPPSA